MVNWYIKGQSEYIGANFHMSFYIDHSGFSEGDYNTQDMETHGATSDPFMAFGIDTGPATWTFGQQQVEIGLLKSHRIKFDTSGVYKWVGPGQDVWELIEAGGGGATVLNDLTDVVIDGTPVDNEGLFYDNGTSKWINQTAAEAGLATAGHGHGQLHDESHSLASHSSEAHNELTGYNDETDVKHLTDAQLGALHTIYSLEQHNNTKHSTNYHSESDGTGVVTVHSGITDAGSGVIISTGERNALHPKDHNNTEHTTNYHAEADGTGVVTVHSDITSVGSGAIITTGERNALHTIYSLEQHDNNFHSTNYEAANANIQSHVGGTPPEDSHHAKQHAMDSATYHTRGDNAVLNASTDFHGFLKKLDGVSTNFMNGQGNWALPAGGGGGSDKGQLQGHIVPLVGCVWGSGGINMYDVNDSAICTFDITANMDSGEDIVLGFVYSNTWDSQSTMKLYVGIQKTNGTEIHTWNYINGTNYVLATSATDFSFKLRTWTIPNAVFDTNDTITVYFLNQSGVNFRAHSMYLRYTEAV